MQFYRAPGRRRIAGWTKTRPQSARRLADEGEHPRQWDLRQDSPRRLRPRSRCSLPAGRGNVHITPWGAGPGGKTPYYFQLKDQGPFAFAGLWERWEKGEEPIGTCTLITTDANAVVGQVHNRMPVILDPGSFDRWLDPNEQRAEVLQAMLVPLPDDSLTTYLVSKVVNNPRNQGPQCIEPAL